MLLSIDSYSTVSAIHQITVVIYRHLILKLGSYAPTWIEVNPGSTNRRSRKPLLKSVKIKFEGAKMR